VIDLNPIVAARARGEHPSDFDFPHETRGTTLILETTSRSRRPEYSFPTLWSHLGLIVREPALQTSWFV
jgi:hypothetical protein